MNLSKRGEYALRALIDLGIARELGRPILPIGEIAEHERIPVKFLEQILLDLKHAGLVASQRGADGGYWLARPPEEITLAEVIRSVEGPIANVRGVGPQDVEYVGSAEKLRDVWIAVRANLRSVLEEVTLADIAHGKLPKTVQKLTRDPDAWTAR